MAFSQLAIKISNTSKFTGGEEADWDTWISRFETRFADVEDKTLAGILLDVLDGTALDVCTKLGKEAYTDYKKLKLTLQSKYGKTSNPRRALAELRCTRQALGESSEAFADRVLVLTKQAYPGFNDQQVQTSALEHFMCGLSDLKLQEKLHARDDVASLDAAVDLSRSYRDKEATLMSMRNVADVDPTALTASKTVYRGGEKSDQGEDLTLLSVVEELRQGLEDIKTQVHKMNGTKTGVEAVALVSNVAISPILGATVPGSLRRVAPLREMGRHYIFRKHLFSARDVGGSATTCLNAGELLSKPVALVLSTLRELQSALAAGDKVTGPPSVVKFLPGITCHHHGYMRPSGQNRVQRLPHHPHPHHGRRETVGDWSCRASTSQ